MAMNEMFAGIGLQRLAVGAVAIGVAVVWTWLLWPTVLPVLGAVADGDAFDGSSGSVAAAGVVPSVRFVLASLLVLVAPVPAYVCGVLWFRTRPSDRRSNLLMTGLVVGGLATLGTFGPGALSLVFGDGSPAEEYLRIVQEHVAAPGDLLVSMVLCAGGTVSAVLAVLLAVALSSAPPVGSRKAVADGILWGAWVLAPVAVATLAGVAVGLFLPLPLPLPS